MVKLHARPWYLCLNDLKFAQHISKITHIGHSRAALILKSFFSRDPEVLIKAYCTYVRSQ